ncbi:response regulator transcription factor [Cohnella hongkongensis]|uniref:Response regulator n=1 Tax=Cohnella hongkongensis TaxID=178337 RepID=A0ABV9FHB4_9BACL
MRVVIVDDEPIIRKWFSMAIQKADREFVVVGSAANGQEALDLCAKEEVDVLVTDIQMPIMDGLTLIQEVRRTFPRIKIVILSNHEDFRYAKEAMKQGASDYLLKAEIEESELFDLLDSLRGDAGAAVEAGKRTEFDRERRALASIFLRRWLAGEETEAASVPGKLEAMGAALKPSDLYVCQFRIDRYGSLAAEWTPEDRRRHTEALVRLIRELAQRETGGGIAFEYADNRFVLLLNVPSSSAKGVHEVLYGAAALIVGEAREKLAMAVSAGVSSCGRTYEEAPALLGQAEEAMKSLFFKAERSVTFYERPESDRTRQAREELRRRLEDIRHDLRQWDVHEAAAKAGRLFRDGAAWEALEPEEIRRAAAAVVRLFKDKAGRASSEPEPILRDDGLLREAEACDYLHTICEWMDRAVAEAAAEIDQGAYSSSAISQAFLYIKRHYAEELSLSDVAKFVHLTPAYLSSLFKKQTGENFNRYLIQVRVEKAKELLMTTDMKISDIAHAVGYPNASYFVRVFKKHEGTSPMEFKNARARSYPKK